MSEMDIDINREEMEPHVYEVGFHIVPSVTEDDVKTEFASVKKLIEGKEGGSIISEGEAKLRTLAYSLSKTVKAIKSTYSKAYFGWIKFTVYPDKIGEIKLAMDEDPSILRYLIVNTVKENTMMAKTEEENEERSSEKEEPKKNDTPIKISEDIDKTIEELVVQ